MAKTFDTRTPAGRIQWAESLLVEGFITEKTFAEILDVPLDVDPYTQRMLAYGSILNRAPGPLPGPAPHDEDLCAGCDQEQDDCTCDDEFDVSEIAGHPFDPGPSRTHCLCGAELMGDLAKRVNGQCGDCAMAEALPGRPRGSLDERIAAAQPPIKDHDPTSAWGAGATPGYEWPE